MRLRKRIGVAVLAASMAFTMLPVHSQVVVKAASAELETEIADVDAETEEENVIREILPETESTGLSAEEIEALSNAENARLKAEMEGMKAAESAVTNREEQEEEAEAGIAALADTEEADIKISGMTIADIYYSVNGKFPLYVEYQTEEELTYSQRRNLKLKVTKEDGTVVVSEQQSDSYRNRFVVEECSNIKSGDNVKLIFSIVEVDNIGMEEKILSTTEPISVQFEAQDNYASRKYLPTEESYYNVHFYLTETEIMPASSVDGIYLIDKDNQIAAGSRDKNYVYSYKSSWDDSRYEEIFENTVSTEGFYISGSVYRTRELKNNEVLYAAYSVNDEMHYLKDITFMVTEKPYITGVSFSGNDRYPGQENSDILEVDGRHIDFNKLSIVLKDKKTGATAGSSVNAVTKIYSENQAYFPIQWEEGYQSVKDGSVSYRVEYSYSDKEAEIIGEIGKTVRWYSENSNDIIWNPKSDVIEYYNKKIPAGISVSYQVQENGNIVTSGSVSVDDTHLIKIPLKETFEHDGTYTLSVTYIDANQNEMTVNERVYIYANKTVQGGDPVPPGDSYIIYQYNQNSYYLSNNEKPVFSIGFYCNDVKKLLTTCSAIIYNNEGQEAGKTEFTLNDNNGLTYQGTHDGALAPGRYRLSFQPDGNVTFNYDIYVEDSSRLSVTNQYNNIVSGNIQLSFVSSDIADWYCNEENQKKLSVKLLDIQKKEIGTYQSGEDFSVTGANSDYRQIQFNDTIKKELADKYFCYVYIYDGEEEIAVSFYYNNSSSIKSLYEYYSYNAEYIYSESTGYISMNYLNNEWNIKGKTTYRGVYGSQSAFPAVVKVTDWHNLKTVKEISVPNSNYKFTEEDLSGLSATKVYRFYVNGADGSASNSLGYINVSYGDPFWTSFSDFYSVSGDFDVTFEFTNKSRGEKNHENYLVCFANAFEVTSPRPNNNAGYKEYYVLRSDAWGWSTDPDGKVMENKTLEGNDVIYDFDWTWDQFGNMIKDSKITMNIKRTGNDFVVDAKIKGADAKDYTYKVMFTTNADKDMTIFFTNEYADVNILSFINNTKQEPETPDDNNNNDNNNNNNNSSSNNNSNNSGTTNAPSTSTGNTSTGTTTEPVKEPEKEEEPKQEEPKNPEDNKNPEQENPPVKEPENTEDTKNDTDNNTTNQTKAKGKLTLKKKKITLKKGQKATIKITSKLNTKVTYKSLNKSVATVSKKGVVTAKKTGKATITVKANGKTKKVTVTVKGAAEKTTGDASVIKLGKNFKLSETKAVLTKGGKMTIQASSGISGKVTYRSLNKNIASVSVKGVVKAKKKGKTAIIIKTGKKTVKLKITVKR